MVEKIMDGLFYVHIRYLYHNNDKYSILYMISIYKNVIFCDSTNFRKFILQKYY